jgi:hypothetical protein
MTNVVPDHAIAAERRALAADPAARALLGAGIPQPPDSVLDFVTGLTVLDSVPFANLIANSAMLPLESLRFFYLDLNWVDALVDGAASIGGSDSLDSSLQEVLLGTLRSAARMKAGITSPTPTGCLLRSALVSDYPRLVMTAYADAAGTQQLAPLRLELLGPNTFIALFDGAMARLDIQEPPEGMQFGVERDASNKRVINLRSLTKATIGQPTGEIPADPFINSGNRVLDVTALQNALQAALPAGMSFGPASFAVQIVRGAETQRYETDVSNAKDERAMPVAETSSAPLTSAEVNKALFGR